MAHNPDGAERSSVTSAGVAEAGGREKHLIERLRSLIRKLEQVPVSFHHHPPATDAEAAPSACFSSSLVGTEAQDEAAFPPLHRLGEPGLHELKPDRYGDTPAALGFALGVLRCQVRDVEDDAPLLWCLTESQLKEWGAPYAPGLLGFGLDPARLLIVRVRNATDAAWTLEEGLKSGALAGLLGQAEIDKPVMARRLGLAAKQGGLPCLLLSDHRQASLPGSLTRWRIAPSLSGPEPFDKQSPGPPRWRLTLERANREPPGRSWILEWNRHAYDFRLAAPLADRAAEAGTDQKRRSSS
ncbi:ImuA family protein [Methyloligella solikamskensis]|uniref:ImuA family protein n=1 Tax=Methyloligella solikamskensis TaxID=1177756 RepID=A0ABW3J7W3_9HYPH